MIIDKFKVEDWFNEYEKSAEYDMADTCVESLSLNDLFEIIGEKERHLEYIMGKKLNYGDIQGSERLLKAIKTMYNNTFPIIITHGAIGANQLVMQTVINAGDKVLSIIPTYQQHYSIPKSLGADTHLLFLKEENKWLPDIDELRKIAGSNTKLICINNPNNPTGSVIPKKMMEEIIEIARINGSYILCDEVYRGLEHNKGNNISYSITDLYERGISTSSMSKIFSLAGLRLGWIVAPKEIMDEIIVHREYNTISVSALDDYFASLAIENRSKIIKRNLNIIIKGKKILSEWIEKEPYISWVEPHGGTTCLLKYAINMPSVDFCKTILKDTGVLFLPGSTLEMEGYIRAGYCSNLSKLKTGLQIFSDRLSRF